MCLKLKEDPSALSAKMEDLDIRPAMHWGKRLEYFHVAYGFCMSASMDRTCCSYGGEPISQNGPCVTTTCFDRCAEVSVSLAAIAWW